MDKDIALLTTVIVNIIGWIVIHNLSSKRERTKEWREFARKTAETIDKLESEAIIYHTAVVRNVGQEEVILAMLEYIERRIMLVQKNLQFKYQFHFLRSSITYDNFMTRNFISYSKNSLLIRSISVNVKQLSDALYSADN